MKRNVKLFALVSLSVLAGLVLKSDGGHGQTEGASSPVIIKRVFLSNQTASISTLTLFTPTTAGLYRVTLYTNVPSQSNGEVCPLFSWNDEWGLEIQAPFIGDFLGTCAASGSSGGGELIIHSLANQPVSIAVNVVPPLDGTYNLLVTVEQL
jgi:hypothetical protein